MTTRSPVAFLSTLTDAERAELQGLFRPLRFSDGERLFAQGEPSDGAYLIESGTVELEMAVPGGSAVVVDRVEAGDFLGEPALLDDAKRNLAARAVGEVRAQHIDRLDFQGLRGGFRPVSFKLLLEITRLAASRVVAVVAATGELQPGREVERASAAALGTSESPGCAFDPRPYAPRMPFFAELTARDLDELLERATLWELPRGRCLLAEGEVSDRCFVVVRGAVEAVDPVTGERVALFAPGELFGHLSPLLGIPTIADCRVREDAVLLEIGPEACAHLFAPSSRLSFKFMNAACLASLRWLGSANRARARATKQRELR